MVKALRFDLNTGQGKVIAEASSGGADSCHLVVSGDDLITANLSPCQVSLSMIS
ncbi:hypothetical protein JB92DRAFT_2982205 [Gautieria morchelliformis]|nr:hypothetical protein JB92DRAFT_2982205 [Gautieria morchelliformis]